MRAETTSSSSEWYRVDSFVFWPKIKWSVLQLHQRSNRDIDQNHYLPLIPAESPKWRVIRNWIIHKLKKEVRILIGEVSSTGAKTTHLCGFSKQFLTEKDGGKQGHEKRSCRFGENTNHFGTRPSANISCMYNIKTNAKPTKILKCNGPLRNSPFLSFPLWVV